MTAARPPGPVRILIVDDHAIVRHGLRSILEREPAVRVVGEAADRAEALTAVDRSQPEVVLLDLKLGASEAEGIDLCRELTRRYPGLRVLVLTTFLNDMLVPEAIRAGAKGYVLKDVDAASLLRAIIAVHKGQSAFDSQTAAIVVRSLSGEQTAADAVRLTEREQEIVRLLAHGLSNRDIGKRLYISETTVKFHVHNVMRKMQVSRRAEVVFRASKLGLI